MDHPTIEVGSILAKNERLLQRTFSTQRLGRQKYSVRLSAAELWQRQNKHLNISTTFSFTSPAPELDWFNMLKKAVSRPQIKNVLSLWKVRQDLRVGLKAFACDGFVYRPRATANLAVIAEQEPSVASFIELGQRTDRFRVCLARLHWKITEKTWRTMRSFAGLLKDELERLDFGKVALIKPITAKTKNWEDLLSDVNHHMGGTNERTAR